MFKAGLLGFLCIFTSTSIAADRLPGKNFFSIEGSAIAAPLDVSPVQMMTDLIDPLLSDVNLLSWVEHRQAPPVPSEKYVRARHFGSWIDLPNDNTCFNVRGLVLVRDSKTPITVIPNDPCFIGKGLWLDPYTNNQYGDAKDLQIDHVVPLKAAYIAGAYKWTWKQRCAYANFMGNTKHLLPVDGKTNNKKSDSGPENWMPPNKNFSCDYVADWLSIKAVWKLMMSEDEVNAINQVIRANRCDVAKFKMSEADLKKQRQAAVELGDLCPPEPSNTKVNWDEI